MSDQESRVRTLTEEGLELYVSIKRSHETKTSNIWSHLCACVKDIDSCEDDSTALEKILTDVQQLFEEYKVKSFEFLEFLGRQKTEQSSNDEVSFEVYEKNIRTIEGNLMKLKELLYKLKESDKLDKTALDSSSQLSSSSTSLSSIIAQKKAKAGEARVRAAYAKKEADIKRQKAAMKEQIPVQNAALEKENAELEADLELLAHTREIAATEAAIETLQIEEEKVKELMNIPLVSKMELTEKYVNGLPDEDHNTPRLMSQFPSQHINPGRPKMMTSQQGQFEPHAFVQQSR